MLAPRLCSSWSYMLGTCFSICAKTLQATLICEKGLHSIAVCRQKIYPLPRPKPLTPSSSPQATSICKLQAQILKLIRVNYKISQLQDKKLHQLLSVIIGILLLANLIMISVSNIVTTVFKSNHILHAICDVISGIPCIFRTCASFMYNYMFFFQLKMYYI